jgi:dGTPase
VSALDALFSFFMEHPEKMPVNYVQAAEAGQAHRVVCDYLAGMTDHFLLRQCRELIGLAIPQVE